jgi:hypothetical protein
LEGAVTGWWLRAAGASISMRPHWCQSEVCNGGFHQFFHNSTGLLAPEAVDGFEAIGARELGSTTGEAMRYFGLPFPRDRHVRLDRLQETQGRIRKGWDPFVTYDDRFYRWLHAEKDRWELIAGSYATGT